MRPPLELAAAVLAVHHQLVRRGAQALELMEVRGDGAVLEGQGRHAPGLGRAGEDRSRAIGVQAADEEPGPEGVQHVPGRVGDARPELEPVPEGGKEEMQVGEIGRAHVLNSSHT